MANMACMALMASMSVLACLELEASPFETKEKDCSRCKKIKVAPDREHRFLIPVSFSLPDSVWLSLSKEIEGKSGALVLRGLPENSFQKLSSQLAHLKQKGMTASVFIDPRIFEDYQVKAVPCFLFFDEGGVEKVSGNIPFRSAEEIVGGRS